jgi:hypothetical protein
VIFYVAKGSAEPVLACGMGCAKGDDAKGGSSVFQRKMRPCSGLLAPHVMLWRGLASPPLPDPRFGGPLGPRGSDGVGLRGIVVPATIFVGRLSCDHPGFNSNALSEDLFSRSLYPATHGAPNDFGMRVFAQIVPPRGGIRNCRYGKSAFPAFRRLVQGFKGFLDDWRAL